MSFLSHLLLIAAVFYFTVVTISAQENTDQSKPSGNGQPNIIPRSGWGAVQPKVPNSKLEIMPPTYAIISHTDSNNCNTKDACTKYVRSVQDLHMKQRGWNDIAYNYLVGGDGNVYEGRGWDTEGAHTRGYNTKSIGIALIGRFMDDTPPQAQLDATKQLLQMGLDSKKLASNYKLLGQDQIEVTPSPGLKVFQIIKTWDHWVDKP